MKIALGSDHAGFDLKEAIKKHLLEKGYEVLDEGSSRKKKRTLELFAVDQLKVFLSQPIKLRASVVELAITMRFQNFFANITMPI